MQTDVREIQRYYEQTRIDYWMLWQGRAKAIHFGYWAKHIRSHNESLLEMNRQLAQAAQVTASDHVLDAGCGIGGSSRWLAQTYGCRVTGINITPFQVEQALAFTREQRLTDLVSFDCQDYRQTRFPDQTFTVAWFLESLVHADDKRRVLAEASRVLQPGGRLVIADYILAERLTPEQKRRMQPWWEGWAMPPLDDLATYQQYLADAGFGDIELVNIDTYVRPSLKRLWLMSLFARPGGLALRHLGIFPDRRYRNIHASVVQYDTFRQSLWQYWLIAATKK